MNDTIDTKPKFPPVYVGILVVLLVVIAGSVYFFGMSNSSKKETVMPAKDDTKEVVKPEGSMTTTRKGMAAETPPPLTAEQTKQLTTGVATDTKEKTFDLTGGNFYFVPNKITVNKGDKVTFIMKNVGGFHDVVIDELAIKTEVVKTGETVTATFTVDKVGSFMYYCDVPSHREKGMVGTLVVL